MTQAKQALIVAAGPQISEQGVAELASQAEFIIAVDGGAAPLADCCIRPHLMIGDFDSLAAEQLETFEREGVEILRFPSAKDESDLELAIAEAGRRGFRELILCGVTGGEPDHALANLLLFAREALRFDSLRIVDPLGIGTFLAGPVTIRQDAALGQLFSIIPLTPVVAGVTVRGSRWSLHNDTLFLGSTRSLRNEFVESSIELSINRGTVALWVLHGSRSAEHGESSKDTVALEDTASLKDIDSLKDMEPPND